MTRKDRPIQLSAARGGRQRRQIDMTDIANIMSSMGGWLFVLIAVAALMSVAYALFTDEGSGITTRVNDVTTARDYLDMWKRGTR
jgi:hypothetical protein